jgi:hypothetical protein
VKRSKFKKSDKMMKKDVSGGVQVTYEKYFLWYETNTWPLASEPAEDLTHRGLNPDHLNSNSALY